MEESDILIKKCIKNYLSGKKLYKKDMSKSLEYFKESLLILENLKTNHKEVTKKHSKLLEESETECYKLMSKHIDTISTIKISEPTSNLEILLKALECGDLDTIKNIDYINFKEEVNNNTILHWAIIIGDTTALKILFKKGGRIDTTNTHGHTLLEKACIEQDPNVINFLSLFGANMKKHIFFRDGKIKFINYCDSIDISILLKLIFTTKSRVVNEKIKNKLKTIIEFINIDEKINFNNYTYKHLFNALFLFLNTIPEEYALTYIDIINEELLFNFKNNLGCPRNKIEVILINLVPFIDYPFNLSIDWLISLEIKYLILKLIKYPNFKVELMNSVWDRYIKTELLAEDYIGILIYQWISKIKL